MLIFRSSHQRCSMKEGVLSNFAKFTGKHLCQSLFFNKVAGLRSQACNFIKKETLAQVLSCEICEISKNTFFTENIRAAASVCIGSGRLEVFCKKGVLKNFEKFTGKHLCCLCRSLFFKKFAGIRPATLFKRKTPFSCKFCRLF